MIYLDKRAGSINLEPHLRLYGIPLEVGILASADVHFIGNGPESKVAVGIEVKTIQDLVNSMQSKRLSGHQLNGLCRDYCMAWIVVIGAWKAGRDGELVQLRGREWRPMSSGTHSVLYSAVINYLTTLELKAGTGYGEPLRWARVNDYVECAAWIAAKYQWFEKEWSSHRSHEAIYNPEYVPKRNGFIRRHIGQCERTIASLDGIDTLAASIAQAFPTIWDLSNATIDELAAVEVDGKRKMKLGEKRAEKVWSALRRRD